MLECVANVSEGRRTEVIDEMARAIGPILLDVHSDPDHHRSVFTFAGDPSEVLDAAFALARVVAAQIDLRDHVGVHPRLGALDVVPFVALDDTPPDVAIDTARRFAAWIATGLGVPAFLYDDADPRQRSLPEVRREAFGARRPDAGPGLPDPVLGAVAVGARPPLVALNLELDRDDLPLARAVARSLRERDGGLPGVRALGLRLASREHAQVSMSLFALGATGLEAACTTARDRIRAGNAEVVHVELVGLVPRAELERCSTELLAWTGIGDDQTIEARMARHAPGVSTAGARADEGGRV